MKAGYVFLLNGCYLHVNIIITTGKLFWGTFTSHSASELKVKGKILPSFLFPREEQNGDTSIPWKCFLQELAKKHFEKIEWLERRLQYFSILLKLNVFYRANLVKNIFLRVYLGKMLEAFKSYNLSPKLFFNFLEKEALSWDAGGTILFLSRISIRWNVKLNFKTKHGARKWKLRFLKKMRS